MGGVDAVEGETNTPRLGARWRRGEGGLAFVASRLRGLKLSRMLSLRCRVKATLRRLGRGAWTVVRAVAALGCGLDLELGQGWS